jgi:hypothetical protein
MIADNDKVVDISEYRGAKDDLLQFKSKWIERVAGDRDLSDANKCILIAAVEKHLNHDIKNNRHGQLWPSIGTIAKEQNRPPGTVKRALREGRSYGYLLIIKQGGGHTPSRYGLALRGYSPAPGTRQTGVSPVPSEGTAQHPQGVPTSTPTNIITNKGPFEACASVPDALMQQYTAFCKEVADHLGEKVLQDWLADVSAHVYNGSLLDDDGVLVLSTSTRTRASYIQRHFANKIAEAAIKVLPGLKSVDVISRKKERKS